MPAVHLLKEHLHVKPGQVDINNALNETADPQQQFSLRSSMDLPQHVELDAGLRWVDTLHNNNPGSPEPCRAISNWMSASAGTPQKISSSPSSGRIFCTIIIRNMGSPARPGGNQTQRLRKDHMALLKSLASPGTNHRPQTGSTWWLAALSLLLLFGSEAQAQTASAREYQIKAVFLFNFSQFVEWPPNAFAGLQAPLVIGVLGDDPFGTFLDEAVRGEKSGGHPIVVRRYHNVGETSGCHILFISYAEADRLELAFMSLKGRSILTVGDANGFAQRGGMIRFVTDNNKIRLRINLEAAKAAGLTLSSKLLRPAEIVTTTKE